MTESLYPKHGNSNFVPVVTPPAWRVRVASFVVEDGEAKRIPGSEREAELVLTTPRYGCSVRMP